MHVTPKVVHVAHRRSRYRQFRPARGAPKQSGSGPGAPPSRGGRNAKASMQPGDAVRLEFTGRELVADGHWGRLRMPWSVVTHRDCRGPIEPEWEPIGRPSIIGIAAARIVVSALSGLSHMLEGPPHWCYLAVGRTDGPEVIFLVHGFVVPELERWLEEHSAGPGGGASAERARPRRGRVQSQPLT